MFATASQRAALEHRIAGYAASSTGQLSAVVDPSRETAVHTARTAALNDGPLTPAYGDGTLAKTSSAQTTAANSRSEPTENGTTDSDSGCGGHQSHAGGDDAVREASPSTLVGSLFAARVVGRLLRVKARGHARRADGDCGRLHRRHGRHRCERARERRPCGDRRCLGADRRADGRRDGGHPCADGRCDGRYLKQGPPSWHRRAPRRPPHW